MDQFQNKDLPQAIRAFTFIQRQLMELAENCGNTLQNGQVNHEHFLELNNSLQKMSYKTNAACSPPPVKPVKSDFDVVKPVGRGGFGSVKLVRHNRTNEVFAMKKVKLQSKTQRADVLMERDIMSYLDHPLIPSMYCTFEEKGNLYMVMEYIGGGDCVKLFENTNGMTEDMARFYMAELVLAVEHLHSQGIMHRDIKPNNMMITATGHLKLVDFGESKICSVKKTACLTEEDCLQVAREFTDKDRRGTDDFLAPEVWLREGYGTPVDWWATGVTFFMFLYGTFPFDHIWSQDLKEHVVNGDVEWPEGEHQVSDEARSLVRLLLEKDPVKRLGTRGASEVKQHPFFKGVDWSNLLNQTPPFVPELENEDTSCVDMMSIHDSFCIKENPDEAADFSYVAFSFNRVYSPELAGHKDEKVKRKNPVKRFFQTLVRKTEKPEKKKKNPVKRFFNRLLKLSPFCQSS